MKFFDKIFCINLDSRPDRWERSKEVFITYGIEPTRVSAIDGKLLSMSPKGALGGVIGCALSHLFIAKMAKTFNFKNYLVFEDDIELDENYNKNLELAIKELPNDWDILYLGANHMMSPELNKVTERIYKCNFSVAASSYAVNYKAYDRIIEKLYDLDKPCDLHFAELQSELNCYVCIPHIAWQRADYSDIQGRYVHYHFLKKHIYTENDYLI